MGTMTVRATHRESTRPVGTVLVVEEEAVIGPLTGWPMHEIVSGLSAEEEAKGRTQYIHTKFCERVE